MCQSFVLFLDMAGRHVATAAENFEIDLLTQMSLVWQNDQTSKLGKGLAAIL